MSARGCRRPQVPVIEGQKDGKTRRDDQSELIRVNAIHREYRRFASSVGTAVSSGFLWRRRIDGIVVVAWVLTKVFAQAMTRVLGLYWDAEGSRVVET